MGLPTDSPTTSDNKTPRKTDMDKVKAGSIKISLSEHFQKLPVGQFLITVVEGP